MDDRSSTCQMLQRSQRALVLMVGWLLTSSILGGCSEPATDGSLVVNGVEIPPTLSDISSFQQGLLEDDVLTTSEYERAVSNTVECLRAGGIKVNGPAWTKDMRHYLYTMESGRDPRPLENECMREFLDQVVEVWDRQVAPSAEERIRAEVDFARCLRSAGIEAAEIGMTVGELIPLVGDTKIECEIPFAVVIPSELMGN